MTAPKRIPQAERRQKILDAARQIFDETGNIDVGLRAISARTGQTTGAIYNLFSGKDAIYAALLQESLSNLHQHVAAAAQSKPDPRSALRAAAAAFFLYYHQNLFEQRLGLYQFEDGKKTGLGQDADKILNDLLAQTIAEFETCFAQLSPIAVSPLSPVSDAKDLSHALTAALIGIGSMTTLRRDQSLNTSGQKLVDTTLNAFLSGFQ